MKLKKVLVAALAMSMGFGVCSMVGCEKPEDPSAGKDPKIWAVYTAYAEEQGDDALSYDEWLADVIEQAKGDNGVTPHIGDNGNWFIGDTDTKVKAEGTKGDNGVTPHIGDNGNWFIGDTDTKVKAEGTKGDNGVTPHIGDNGNWFIGETDTEVKAEGTKGDAGNGWLWGAEDPSDDLGNNGDLYLKYVTGRIFGKTDGKWNYLNSLNGNSEEIYLGQHTFKVDEKTKVSINLEPGYYEISVSSAYVGAAQLYAYYVDPDSDAPKLEKGNVTHLLYDEGKHAYIAVLNILEGDTELTFSTDTEITGEFCVTKWTAPELKADGKTYIVPALYYDSKSADTSRLISIPFDVSLFTGTYKITIQPLDLNVASTYPLIGIRVGDETKQQYVRSSKGWNIELDIGSTYTDHSKNEFKFTSPKTGHMLITIVIESVAA